MPSIHPQIRARHESARVAQQEHGCSPVVFRFTQLPEHILGGPIGAAFGVETEELFDHGGHDVAGGDGVDADAVGAPFGGEVAGELDDAGFACVVGGTDETLTEIRV